MGKIAAVIAFVALLAACGTEWQPSNMAAPGAIEQYTCEQVQQATSKLQAATSEQDPEALAAFGVNNDNKSATEKRLEERAKTCNSAPSATPSNTNINVANCPSGYVVKLDPNYENKLKSEGISPEPEVAHGQIAQFVKEDPRGFQVYYNNSPPGKKAPIQKAEDIAPLQNGACFTENGVKWYNEWLVLWNLTELTKDTLPKYGTNTGAVPNGQAFQEKGHIPPSPALKAVLRDANNNVVTEYHIRTECAQIVSAEEIPGLPEKPKDVPSVNCKEKCDQPPLCTGNNCGPCTNCPDSKVASESPEQNNGGSVYGGDGTQRHTAPATAEQPKAGDPPPTYQPPAQTPAPNPVPGGTSAPPAPTLPTETPAPPPSSAPSQCSPAPGRTCPTATP